MPGLENYIDVQTRINAFWRDHPGGAIRTRMMSLPDDFDRCRFLAEVYREQSDPVPAATGYAFEVAGGRGANQTSHEENCETSAIGRALANLGYAKSADDRPSRQEMEKVESVPDEPRPAPPAPIQRVTAASAPNAGPKPVVNLGPLHGDMERAGVNKEDQHPMAHDIACVWFDVESLTDIDHEQLGRMRRLVQTKPVEELYEKWKVAKLKMQERQPVSEQLAGMPQPMREYGS